MERSLYDRLGGADAIAAVARAFDLVAVLDDFKVGKAEQGELLTLLRPER